jgi:hypothetical protein
LGAGVPNAIPTEYAGIRFRSRLEATWAAFFDLMQWPWEYEPFDLAGYIPDFVLTLGKGRQRPVVEVKAIIDWDDVLDASMKISCSGWGHDYIILGTNLYEPPHGALWKWKRLALGFCVDAEFRGEVNHAYPFRCFFCGKMSPYCFVPEKCPWCGETLVPDPQDDEPWPLVPAGLPSSMVDPGGGWLGWVTPDTGLLCSMWATAKNRTQWRGEFGS